MEPREAAATLLRGAAMGTVEVMPGISGGTVALIVGIYDRLIAAIASLDPRPLVHLLRPHDPDERDALVAAWNRMDLTFLLVLGAGMLSAVVVLSQVIPIALEEHRALAGAFFAGLIAASAVLIGRQVPWTRTRAALAAVSAAAVVVVAVFAGSAAAPSTPLVFVGGAVAISAMVLPGLSGSLLLLILGQYEYLLEELDAFLSGIADLASGGTVGDFAGSIVVVAAFLSGAVVGLLTVARAVDYALERDRATTIAVLVGLMTGGLYPPAEFVVEDGSSDPLAVAGIVGAAVFGIAIVTAFDRATGDLEYV